MSSASASWPTSAWPRSRTARPAHARASVILGDSPGRSDRRRLVERFEEGVPGQRRALDADGELDDALQRLEVAERHLSRRLVAIAVGVLDRHHPLEPLDEG